jgi:hypothetical protein
MPARASILDLKKRIQEGVVGQGAVIDRGSRVADLMS